jgi:hypothetical protein
LESSVLNEVNGGTLADGVHTLHLVATDKAGNATAFDVGFTLDTVGPAAPVFDLAVTSDTGVVGDHITSASQVALRGQTEPNAAVSLLTLGRTTQADSNGVFLFDNVALTEGDNAFVVSAIDAAGNQTTSSLTIRRDSTPPSLAASLSNDTGASSTDGITNTAAISGTVIDNPVGSGISDLRGGFDATSSANYISLLPAVQNDGSFQLNTARINQIAGGTLADGAHTLHLVATDKAGNATAFDVSFTLDAQGPAAPVFDLAPGSDTGVLGDHITSAGVVTLQGLTDRNAAVSLSPLGLSATADSQGVFHFDNVALALGGNAFTAVATDVAGNQTIFSLTLQRVAAIGHHSANPRSSFAA